MSDSMNGGDSRDNIRKKRNLKGNIFLNFVIFNAVLDTIGSLGWVFHALEYNVTCLHHSVYIIIYILSTASMVTNIMFLLYNLYINNHYRNFFDHFNIDSQLTFYLIFLSITIGYIGWYLKVILAFFRFPNCYHLSEKIFNSLLLIYFLLVIITLINANISHEYGEEWTLNLSNLAAIILSVMNIGFYTVTRFFIHRLVNFKILIKSPLVIGSCLENYINVTDPFSKIVFKTIHNILSPKVEIELLFGIFLLLYFCKPLIRHVKHLQILQSTPNIKSSIPSQQAFLPIMICTFCGIITVSVLYIMEWSNLGLICLYLLSIIITKQQLASIFDWTPKLAANSEFEVLLWMGFIGQLLGNLPNFGKMLGATSNDYSGLIAQVIIYLIRIVYIFIFHIFINHLSRRHWQKSIQPLPMIFNSLFLLVHNGFECYSEVFPSSLPKENCFVTTLLMTSIYILSFIFKFIFRYLSCVTLINYILFSIHPNYFTNIA